MKKIKIFLDLTLILLLTTSLSCERENLTENESLSNSNDGVRYIEIGTSENARGMINGMLEFDDDYTFLNLIEKLAIQAEDHDDAFVAKYDYLNDDDLEAMEIAIGHDVHQPFIDYENRFPGFKSLRNSIRTTQERLIQSALLNDSNDPDNHYVFDDEVRTVLNDKAQVKIGKSLYQMTRFGYVEITDGDFHTLALVESSDASQLNLPNIVIHGGYYGSSSGNNDTGGPTNCKTDIEETNYVTTSSDRRIKGIQKLKGYSALWGTKIKSKTQYQKKRWWGGWTGKRTRITAKITGESVNQYCSQNNEEDEIAVGRKHKVKAKIAGPSSYVYKTNYHELKTIHFKNGNNNIIDDFFYE